MNRVTPTARAVLTQTVPRPEFPALFTAKEGGGYSVSFPDLEGCSSEGDTLEEARRNASEALTGYLESIFCRGFEVPVPSACSGSDIHLIRPQPHVAVPLLLRMARTSEGLTQTQLAERLGVTYQNYQRWENPNTCNISLRTLERISNALECDFEVTFSVRTVPR